MNRGMQYSIPLEARKDIAWWSRFAQEHNDISLIWLIKQPNTDIVLQMDASKKGYGGICGQQYFRGRFPRDMQALNIAILEIWGHQLKGKYFWIHVDNEAVATVLNTGASREMELQNTLWEIALLAARHQFVIKARHIAGVENRVPDWLSRWGLVHSKREFRKFAQDKSLSRVRVHNTDLQYIHKW